MDLTSQLLAARSQGTQHSIAIAVLKEVEEGRLSLDRRVSVRPAEVAPGWKGREDLWLKPSNSTVEELLELSVTLSDNTASLV